MKVIFIVTVYTYSIISTNSQLLEKFKMASQTIETKTESNSPVRLSRHINPMDPLMFLVPPEKIAHSGEIPTFNSKLGQRFKVRKYIESIPHQRKPRGSGGHRQSDFKNLTAPPVRTYVDPSKTKPVLVKKPIPKYNEMSYDEDFQMNTNKSPVQVMESDENEDEDFNVDDYDFDINHDEFIGSGKPIQPRLKSQNVQTNSEHNKQSPKTKNKVNIPASKQALTSKKERSTISLKNIEKKDYYDDTVTTKVIEKLKESVDGINDESKEYENTSQAKRHTRSSCKKNSREDKISSKLLTSLPMFPQMPSKEKNRENIHC